MSDNKFSLNKFNGKEFSIEITKNLAGEELRIIKDFKKYMDSHDVYFNDLVFLAYPNAEIEIAYSIIAFGENIGVVERS